MHFTKIRYGEVISMIEIFDVRDKMDYLDEAIMVFWKQWGNQGNFKFYQDCMMNACHPSHDLPRFYIAVHNDTIIGTYALLRNDLISRQDLFPWLACLYIDLRFRGNNLGAQLLEHAARETEKLGLNTLYLCTDIDGYYEKKGWAFLSTGYMFNGEAAKIYEMSVDRIDKDNE